MRSRVEFNRIEAKHALASLMLQVLGDEAKKELLAEYWMYDSEAEVTAAIESGALPDLPKSLINLIARASIPSDPSPICDPLLMDALILGLAKVTNSYLELKLGDMEKT